MNNCWDLQKRAKGKADVQIRSKPGFVKPCPVHVKRHRWTADPAPSTITFSLATFQLLVDTCPGLVKKMQEETYRVECQRKLFVL